MFINWHQTNHFNTMDYTSRKSTDIKMTLILIAVWFYLPTGHGSAVIPTFQSTFDAKCKSMWVKSKQQNSNFKRTTVSLAKLAQADTTQVKDLPPSSFDQSSSFSMGASIMDQSDVCIVGGGPAGLLTAIMLAQKFPAKSIKVMERLPHPPPDPRDLGLWTSDVAKFYLIGLGGRGQRALDKFHVWDGQDGIRQFCTAVVGRRDWTPDSNMDEITDENIGGVERIFVDRPYTTQVLPRDKLVGALYQYILRNHNDQIRIEFGKEVSPVDFGKEDTNRPDVILR